MQPEHYQHPPFPLQLDAAALHSFTSLATLENKGKLQAISERCYAVLWCGAVRVAYALCSFSLKQFLKHFSTEKTVRHTFLLRFCNHDKCALCSECNAPRRVFTADSLLAKGDGEGGWYGGCI